MQFVMQNLWSCIEEITREVGPTSFPGIMLAEPSRALRDYLTQRHLHHFNAQGQALFLISFSVQSSVRRDTSPVTITRHVQFVYC